MFANTHTILSPPLSSHRTLTSSGSFLVPLFRQYRNQEMASLIFSTTHLVVPVLTHHRSGFFCVHTRFLLPAQRGVCVAVCLRGFWLLLSGIALQFRNTFSCWTFSFFSLAIMDKVPLKVLVQLFLRTYISFLLGKYPGAELLGYW